MRKNNTDDLGGAPLLRLVLRYSVPCVLSLLISALYNIVDQVFIGNSELSTLGNAATGVVFPIFVVAQGFAWWFGDGCAAHLNICQGGDGARNVHKTIGSCTTFTVIVSIVLIAVIYPLKNEILALFGASENSIGMAAEYLEIVLAFFPAFMAMNMLNSVVRADGSPIWAMIIMIAGAVTNLALDPVFIFVCKWGMRGAAAATGIGQAVSLVLTLLYLPRTKTFKLCAKSFIPDFKSMAPALKLGASSLIAQMTIVVISLVSNIMLAKYGAASRYGKDVPIAVIGIESKVFTVVVNLVVGVVLGCQPIIGFNLGAGNFARVRKLYAVILAYTLGIGIAATLLFELAPNAVASMFGTPTNIPNPDDYWDFARRTFRIFLMFVALTCFVKMTSIFFQAVGKPIQAIVSSLIRDLLCFVPLVVTLPLAYGIDGVLYAAPISDAVGFTVAAVLTAVYFVRLGRSEKEEKDGGCGLKPDVAASRKNLQ